MIGLLAIVLAFVLIGVTVVSVALRSGRKENARSKRGSAGGAGLALALTLGAFGVAIPAAVMAYNADSQSKQAPGSLELTASQQSGRQIFAKNCATCHTLAASNSVGKVGPSLDAIIPPIPEKEARIQYINDAVVKGRARGQGQMPAGLIDGTDMEEVSDFIATVAGR